MLLVGLCAVLAAALLIVSVSLLRARRRCLRLTDDLARAMRETSQHQNALQQRKHLDTLKDEFISTVSHELRTPLTSIRAALGLLSAGVAGKVDEKAANLLRIASSNTDRLVRLINDILDLERMESGRAPLMIRRCSLPELVQQAVDTMKSMAEAAGVRLEIAPEPANTPITFDGDSDRILQVLTNLLSNAIKFSPSGAPVRILTASDGNNLVLQIEDSGRGVPPDKLETIFDRFGQVEAADAKQKGGSGLGLAICRSIVVQHGGTIWAERNDSGGRGRPGTTVNLRLPRFAPGEHALPPVDDGGTILVVHEDETVREAVGDHLRRNGYKLVDAATSDEALALASQHRVDAILLDLYMSESAGSETIERLKKDASTAEIPVAILSVLSPSARNAELAQQAVASTPSIKPAHEGHPLAELGCRLHSGTGPGRLLLVEDDEDLASAVLSSFSGPGRRTEVTVERVASIDEAEAVCQSNPPDLLVLDLALGNGSGFALVNWLRRQPKLRTLPLVVYSGSEVSQADKAQLRTGPAEVLDKTRVQPRHVEDLILAMLRHMGKPALGSA